MEVLFSELKRVALEQGLVSKAISGAKSWASSGDFDIDNAITQRFQYEFHSHKLCFKHEYLDNPYIETNITVVFNKEEIGYYSYHSLLNGEVIDDVFVVTDNELKYS